MKRIYLAAFLLAASPAMAQTSDICPALGSLAASVMAARQAGVPMSAAMAVADRGEVLAGVARAMVLDAYERPEYLGPTAQNRAVNSFRNEVEFSCYSASL